MSTDLNETKKQIAREWLNAIPLLSKFTNTSFYRILGPVLLGIEIVKLPMSNEYRPHFVLYGLWKETPKKCLDFPVVMSQFYDTRGFQYSVPYAMHEKFMPKLVESVHLQAPMLFDGNVSLNSLIALLETHTKNPPLSAAPHSFLQAQVEEAKVLITATVDLGLAKSLAAQLEPRNWDEVHFKHSGITPHQWIMILKSKLDNFTEVEKIIHVNISDKKLSKLQQGKVI